MCIHRINLHMHIYVIHICIYKVIDAIKLTCIYMYILN